MSIGREIEEVFRLEVWLLLEYVGQLRGGPDLCERHCCCGGKRLLPGLVESSVKHPSL